MKICIQQWLKDSWVPFIIRHSKERPSKELKKLCEFEKAKEVLMPKNSRLSDFLKQKYNISKSKFKILLSDGAIKKPNPWVKGHLEKIKEDEILSGIESFKVGKTTFLDLWVYNPV